MSDIGGRRSVTSATCLGCGCACDDIEILVEGDRIREARNACPLGVSWFGQPAEPSRARVRGRDVPVDEALDAAARLLAGARRPLVYLAPDISCETQREAAGLADWLGAALDCVTSSTALTAIVAAQERGRCGATLGEIRNRGDVLVFWGVDPAVRYPRFWTRYAQEPAGLHGPNGLPSRHVVAVDIDDWRGPDGVARRVTLSAAEEVTVLTTLAACARGASVPGVASRGSRSPIVSVSSGLHQRISDLVEAFLGGRYVVLVTDGEPDDERCARDPGRAAALIALTQALNGPTRAALMVLRAGGNRSGAEAVLTWQTGYPAAIDFSGGAPRYRPYDGTAAALIGRGDVDAAVVIGAVALAPADVVAALRTRPAAVIGPGATASELGQADAAIDTATAGIHEAGTILRMDDVPLPVRALVSGPPAAVSMACDLRRRVVSIS
jgi:formylmethanofuran dehydrogenase subunit B